MSLGTKEKRKKKEKNRTDEKKKKKKRKKGTNSQRQPRKKKKKSKGGQKLRLWVPHVCLFTEMPLSYELWKLKTAFCCFQFP